VPWTPTTAFPSPLIRVLHRNQLPSDAAARPAKVVPAAIHRPASAHALFAGSGTPRRKPWPSDNEASLRGARHSESDAVLRCKSDASLRGLRHSDSDACALGSVCSSSSSARAASTASRELRAPSLRPGSRGAGAAALAQGHARCHSVGHPEPRLGHLEAEPGHHATAGREGVWTHAPVSGLGEGGASGSSTGASPFASFSAGARRGGGEGAAGGLGAAGMQVRAAAWHAMGGGGGAGACPWNLLPADRLPMPALQSGRHPLPPVLPKGPPQPPSDPPRAFPCRTSPQRWRRCSWAGTRPRPRPRPRHRSGPAASLWVVPAGRPRPRQPAPPARRREVRPAAARQLPLSSPPSQPLFATSLLPSIPFPSPPGPRPPALLHCPDTPLHCTPPVPRPAFGPPCLLRACSPPAAAAHHAAAVHAPALTPPLCPSAPCVLAARLVQLLTMPVRHIRGASVDGVAGEAAAAASAPATPVKGECALQLPSL
jgi:hypothetical protein